MSSGERFDVVVVGTGASGSWAIKELADRGLSVLGLDAGPRSTPNAPSGVPAFVPGTLRDATFRLRSALRGQHVQARATGYNSSNAHLWVSDRENPYSTARGKPFVWFRGRQVGGRLLTWARAAFRHSDLDFAAGSRDGQSDDWPIRYDDLVPYYDRIEQFWGLFGTTEGLPQLPDGRYRGPRSLTPFETEWQQRVESTWPGRRFIPTRSLAEFEGPLSPPLAAALASGRVHLQPDTVVRSISVDPQSGLARGVDIVDRASKESRQVQCRAVVLCASAFESVRILFNSATDRHPHGLGNSSDLLGRYVMDHLFMLRFGSVPPAKRAGLTTPNTSAFYLPRFSNLSSRDAPYFRGFGIQGAASPRGGPLWYLGAFGEMLPRRENRVTVNPKRRDAWGVPIAHISCAHGENDVAMIAAQAQVIRELEDVMGLKEGRPDGGRVSWLTRLLLPAVTAPDGSLLPGASVHELGGARMGQDPASSVLNRYNQVWDAPNVLVCDGAAFVSSGCQNTTLTMMALAVRACEHLGQRFAEIAAP